jgi:hypothetical protein
MVHVGVDLDKRTSQVAVLTEDGELTRHRLVNDGERVRRFFAELPPQTPVAIAGRQPSAPLALVLAATQAARRSGPLRTWFYACAF